MIKRSIRCVMAFAVVSVALAQTTSMFLMRAKAESSIWSGSLTVAEGQGVTTERVQNRLDCTMRDVYIKKFGTPIDTVVSVISLGNFVYENIGRRCVIENTQGYFTSETYSTTDKLSYELHTKNSQTYWLDPAPAGTVVFVGAKTNYNDSFYSLGIESQFAKTGELVNGITNIKWRYNDASIPLKDMLGNKIRFYDHAFSANGQYAVVRFDRSVAVIDLQELTLTPVGYIRNWSKYADMAVSDDGRYVALQNNGVFIYDTSGCQRRYAYSLWDVASYVDSSYYTGCEASGNLQPDIQGLLDVPASLSFFQQPRFSSNGSTLYIAGGVRKPDAPISSEGVAYYDWREYSIVADSYVSNASGYLAMGDSFSSGEGDTEGGTWYEPGTDEQGNRGTFEGRNLCHLSRRSYPYLIAKDLGLLDGSLTTPTTPTADSPFHSVACSGAVMHNVVGGASKGVIDYDANENAFEEADNQYRNDYYGSLDRWQPGRIKQLDFTNPGIFGGRSSTEQPPGVITLGIGGNDAGFGDVIAACTSVGTCDQANTDSVDNTSLAIGIAGLKPKLTKTYQEIKNNNPETRVYVHGYPIFVKGYDGNCGNNVHLNPKENALVEEGVKYMNAIVKAAASEAGVFYVDVTDILNGVNLCSNVSDQSMAVNGVTAGNDIKLPWYAGMLSGGYCTISSGCLGKESFHPNPRAHERYAATILSQTNSLTIEMPEPQEADYPLPPPFFGPRAYEIVSTFNGSSASDETVIPEAKPFLATGQESLRIVQDGLLPGSSIEASVHSDPIVLGEYTVDATGQIDVIINLPENLEPGAHQIHITGHDAFGNEIDYFESIIVGESTTDFDNDGLLNEDDSCPIIPNTFMDQDADGIDDACDVLLTQADNEQDEAQLEKGQPNPETVAGTGAELTLQGVLGASTTTAATAGGSLENAGTKAMIYVVVGLLILAGGVLVGRKV